MMLKKRNQIRIIAGSLRGRKITFPDSAGLRPTPDRVRETLFNWLNPVIRGSHCLDLFAGSGALSFEAISRGAERVVLLEKSTPVFKYIEEQAGLFNIPIQKLEIKLIDSQGYLKDTKQPFETFDIVFVDPPYGSHLLFPSFALLHEKGWVKEKTLIYCGTDEPIAPQTLPVGWKILREQKAGVVHFYLIEVALKT